MDFGTILLGVAICWSVWQIVQFRKYAMNGLIIIPVQVAATAIFALCILGVLISGISPFHLLWMFLVSYVLGTILLLFPWFQIVLLTGLTLLAFPFHHDEEPDSTPPQPSHPRRHASKKRKKKRRKR